MLSQTFKNILAEVAKTLNDNEIDWMLIGSANLSLQGMDFVPDDLDILASIKDEGSIRSLFADIPVASAKTLPNGEALEQVFFSTGLMWNSVMSIPMASIHAF